MFPATTLVGISSFTGNICFFISISSNEDEAIDSSDDCATDSDSDHEYVYFLIYIMRCSRGHDNIIEHNVGLTNPGLSHK